MQNVSWLANDFQGHEGIHRTIMGLLGSIPNTPRWALEASQALLWFLHHGLECVKKDESSRSAIADMI